MAQDRVTYSFSMKIGLPDYSSADFHIGLSSDVKEGESSDKAFARVKKWVESKLEGEVDEIEKIRESKT